MSVLNKLTEGIVNRDLKKEGDALLSKWERTGLLEGLTGDSERNGMARLLENQAKQLLKEASSMAAGDVEGFASVAFPLVRRVFGGLLANDLVSVQPMSLPSGLIFFLDFTYEANSRLHFDRGESIYGGGVVGSAITGGVSDITEAGGGLYNLQAGYSNATASATVSAYSGSNIGSSTLVSALTEAQKKVLKYDPDLLADTTSAVQEFHVNLTGSGVLQQLNREQLTDVTFTRLGAGNDTLVRRLTTITGTFGVSTGTTDVLEFYVHDTTTNACAPVLSSMTMEFPINDSFAAGGAIGSVTAQDTWGLEEPTPGTGTAGSSTNKHAIPEIDIKVDSIAVTAQTRKLKAKWSPELGQDLNAYHNLDAEVELTSILSEQIALEIDREILKDLVEGATAGTYYWSRSPGLFVHRTSGMRL
jgi:hypothetical protein